jgi:hypothetical protein
LDVLYRNAGQELVANQLAQVSAQLKAQVPPTAEQTQLINQYLSEFIAKTNATSQAFDKAGVAFFKIYTPVLDEANRH